MRADTAPETRRSRRSSLPLSRSPRKESPPLSLEDLVVSPNHASSLNSIISRFPGRSHQIELLADFLGPVGSPSPPLFVYGAPATGKTSVLLLTFKTLNRPVVYTSCRSSYSPRIFFESILKQLHLLLRGSFDKRCEKPSEFFILLRDAISNLPDNICSSNGGIVYIIIDNLELIREWEKSSLLLQFLFNLHDTLRMATKVAFIFVSSTSPDTFYRSESSSIGYVDPVPLHFPEYTEDDLRLILTNTHQEDKKLYTSFLNIVLSPFARVTRRIDELSDAFQHLYALYCEPLEDKETAPNEQTKRKLLNHLQPHIAPAMNQIFRCRPPSNDLASDFHISTSAKYLLISAFLASRNPATLDGSLFDAAPGGDTRKRKRKWKSIVRNEAAEEAMVMKGPGSFPLERLLVIFQCITSCEDDDDVDSKMMCDVLVQISSLCNGNFILKSSCPLDGATRFRSTVSEEFALKVARSLNFPLTNYLYRN